MIHGIYVKSKPKNKWQLFSVTISPEVAMQDAQEAEQKAKLEGNDDVKVAIQSFDSSFHIPEYLAEVKDQKPLFN